MAGYGSDDDFNAWLADAGYELPDGAPVVAVLRQRGSVYVDGTYATRFPGIPTGGFAQERQWPRTGAFVTGGTVPDDLIPDAVIKASYYAGYAESQSPGCLSASGSRASFVKRERVEGVVDIDYYGPDDADYVGSLTPIFTTIDGLMAPLVFLQNVPGVLVV